MGLVIIFVGTPNGASADATDDDGRAVARPYDEM